MDQTWLRTPAPKPIRARYIRALVHFRKHTGDQRTYRWAGITATEPLCLVACFVQGVDQAFGHGVDEFLRLCCWLDRDRIVAE